MVGFGVAVHMTSADFTYWNSIKDRADAVHKIINNPDLTHQAEEDSARIIKALDIKGFDRVAEFGCGMGRLMKPIIEKTGCALVGFDISKKMLDLANDYCPKGEFKLMTEDDKLNYQDYFFDKIYSHIVLQHIEKTKAFNLLTEFNNVLKMGGKVFLQYPCLEGEIANYSFHMINKYKLGDSHCRVEFYNREELQTIFPCCGFRIDKIVFERHDWFVHATKMENIQERRK